jgi:hypothetical protein
MRKLNYFQYQSLSNTTKYKKIHPKFHKSPTDSASQKIIRDIKILIINLVLAVYEQISMLRKMYFVSGVS